MVILEDTTNDPATKLMEMIGHYSQALEKLEESWLKSREYYERRNQKPPESTKTIYEVKKESYIEALNLLGSDNG